MSQRSTTEERLLQLLGSGINPEIAASAVGLTVSRVSQYLSDENFAAQVAELRFKNLQKHNERDATYDDVESQLLEQLKDCLPLMTKPMEILRAIQIINAAKRRGQSAPESVVQQHQVISLVMPTQIIQKFTTNIMNQVVQAGDQELLTIQSGTLLDKHKVTNSAKAEGKNERERETALIPGKTAA